MVRNMIYHAIEPERDESRPYGLQTTSAAERDESRPYVINHTIRQS